jgi:hypothetical protein
VGEDRGSKETDGCPLTLAHVPHAVFCRLQKFQSICQQSKSFTKLKILLHAKPLVKIIAFDACKLLHLDMSQN